jgi:hypothetical protein
MCNVVGTGKAEKRKRADVTMRDCEEAAESEETEAYASSEEEGATAACAEAAEGIHLKRCAVFTNTQSCLYSYSSKNPLAEFRGQGWIGMSDPLV